MSEAEHRLGMRYYSISSSGGIKVRAVLELPFELCDGCVFNSYEAVDMYIRKIILLYKKTDSISEQKRCEKIMSDLDDPNRYNVLVEKLMTEAVQYTRNRFSGIFSTDADKYLERYFDPDEIPNDYLLPGDVVWFPVTPETGGVFSGNRIPKLFFVMKSVVRKTTFGKNGIRYSLDGPYDPKKKTLCTSEQEAKELLMKQIIKMVPDSVDAVKVITANTPNEEQERRMEVYRTLAGIAQRNGI
jgi:hypothetical protein